MLLFLLIVDPGCVRVRCGCVGEVVHLSFADGDADAPALRSCHDAGFAVVCTSVEVVHLVARVALCQTAFHIATSGTILLPISALEGRVCLFLYVVEARLCRRGFLLFAPEHLRLKQHLMVRFDLLLGWTDGCLILSLLLDCLLILRKFPLLMFIELGDQSCQKLGLLLLWDVLVLERGGLGEELLQANLFVKISIEDAVFMLVEEVEQLSELLHNDQGVPSDRFWSI